MQADQQKNAAVPFTVVGADAGLIAKPVVTNNVTMSIAERWEVVIDFSKYAGQNVTMYNMKQTAADIDYPATDRIMRFVVGNTVSSTAGNGDIPNPLRSVPFPPNTAVATRNFLFERKNGGWRINGISWSDVAERVLSTPKRGSIEIWNLQNGGGGWSHPIHIHLIDFQVIKRVGSDRSVLPYEAAAQQDVVWLGPGETVSVIARYSPWPGLYMFHCHNLIHEDHEMLAAFNVTQVNDLGLNETELFINPMEDQYRAKSFPPNDFIDRTGDFTEQACHDKVDFFANKKAYENFEVVEEKLAEYWDGRTAKEKRGEAEMTEGFPATVRHRAVEGLEYAKKLSGAKFKRD
jgi:bilirubin oxidase